jgi:hypothetical protein
MYLNNASLTVTTFWRVTGQLSQPVEPEVEVTYPSGYTTSFMGFPATEWLPMASWPEGVTMVVKSDPLALPRQEPGTVRVGVRLRSATGADGALSVAPVPSPDAGSIRAFTSGDLRAQAPSASPVGTPDSVGSAVDIGEKGTLVSFAREAVEP